MPIHEQDKLETALAVSGEAEYIASMMRAAEATARIAKSAKDSASAASFGDMARKANDAEAFLRPWIARVRKLLLAIVVPFPYKALVVPAVELVKWLEGRIAALRTKAINAIWPQDSGGQAGRTYHRNPAGRFAREGTTERAVGEVKSASSAAGDALQRLAKRLSAIGAWAARMAAWILKATAAVALAAAAAVLALWHKAGQEAEALEAVLKDVELQSGATAEQMKEIKAAALSPNMVMLGKSATEAAEGYKRLASEGYDVIAMQQMMAPITRVATVFGLEHAQVTKLMINLMNQYGLSAKDMTYISDVLVGALNNTSLQADEVADSLQYAGLAASSLGWSLEETMAVIDPLVATIGNAQMAGVYFREMVNSLKDPTDETAEAFAKAGLNINDFSRESRSAASFIGWLKRGTWDAGLVAKAFGNRADAAATVLLRQTVPAIEAATGEIWEMGAALKNAEQKMLTVQGRKAQFAAMWRNLLATLGGRTEGFVSNSIGALTRLVMYIGTYVTKWAEAKKKTDGLFTASEDNVQKMAIAIVDYLLKIVQGIITFVADAGNAFGKLFGWFQKIKDELQLLIVRFKLWLSELKDVFRGGFSLETMMLQMELNMLTATMERLHKAQRFDWDSWKLRQNTALLKEYAKIVEFIRSGAGSAEGYDRPDPNKPKPWSTSEDSEKAEEERRRAADDMDRLAKKAKAINDAVQMVIGGRLSEMVQDQIRRLGAMGDGSKGWLAGIRPAGSNKIVLELRSTGELTDRQVAQVQNHLIGIIKQAPAGAPL